MFSFLDLVSPLPRSKATPLNSLTGGSGVTKSSSQPPATTYSMRRFIATNSKTLHGGTPYYRHATQTEAFTSEQGTMKTTAVGGDDILAGYTAATQPSRYHNLVGADPLQDATPADIVTPGEDKADEVFFRNLYSYLDDCEKHKRGLSPFQMLMFMTSADTRLTLPAIQQGISKMIGFFGGVVAGEWFLTFGRGDPEQADGVELDDMAMEEMNEK